MTKQELEAKVINAAAKVEKCKAIIAKHRKQLEKMVQKGADKWEIGHKEDDIKSAKEKLADAERILANWKEKLEGEISKEAFIAANTPEAIKDFLDKWEVKAIAYYLRSYDSFVEFKKNLNAQYIAALREAVNTFPELERYRGMDDHWLESSAHYIERSRAAVEFFKERKLDYRGRQKRLQAASNVIVNNMCAYYKAEEREAWLKKTIAEEKKAKLLDFISRINNVVGTITDAKGLRIGDNGEINGFVVGTEGKATVETIGAGGWNIQRFHYRVLVHEIK